MKTTSILATLKRGLVPALAISTLLPGAAHALNAGSDSFANATVITTTNEVSSETSILTFTKEAGEPGHLSGNNSAGMSAWWRWTAPEDGFCTVDTLRHYLPDFVGDTVVAVYTGDAVNGLTAVVKNDDHGLGLNGAAGRNASATFYAQKNVTYHIAVDGFAAGSVTANFHKVNLRLRLIPARPMTLIGVFGDGKDPNMQGQLTLSKTAGNAFTAKVTLGAKVYSFSGVFGVDGYYGVSFVRPVHAGSPPALPITLWIDGAANGSTNLNGNYNYAGLYEVAKFGPQKANTLANTFTAVIRHPSVEAVGSLSVSVKPTGAVTATGVAPDGTVLTLGTSVCVTNSSTIYRTPFYRNLPATQGFFRADLQLSEFGADDRLASPDNAVFSRAAKAGATFYPAGMFYTNFTVVGGAFNKPAAGARALNFLNGNMGNGQLVVPMSAGEIANNINKALLFSTLNKFTFASPLPHKPVLTLNTATGLVTGTIIEPAGKTRNIRGALVMENGTPKLEGLVTGATKNVKFSVTQ